MQSGTGILGVIGCEPHRDEDKSNVVRFVMYEDSYTKDRTTGAARKQKNMIDCYAVNRIADVVEKHLRKGSLVFASGRFDRQEYVWKGRPVSRVEFKFEKVNFLRGTKIEEEGIVAGI